MADGRVVSAVTFSGAASSPALGLRAASSNAPSGTVMRAAPTASARSVRFRSNDTDIWYSSDPAAGSRPARDAISDEPASSILAPVMLTRARLTVSLNANDRTPLSRSSAGRVPGGRPGADSSGTMSIPSENSGRFGSMPCGTSRMRPARSTNELRTMPIVMPPRLFTVRS